LPSDDPLSWPGRSARSSEKAARAARSNAARAPPFIILVISIKSRMINRGRKKMGGRLGVNGFDQRRFVPVDERDDRSNRDFREYIRTEAERFRVRFAFVSSAG